MSHEQSPNRTPSTWRPLLAGERADVARTAIDTIAAELADVAPATAGRRGGAGLASGYAGIALMYAYLDEYRPDAGYRDTAMDMLDRALDGIEEVLPTPSLYGGFTGVMWTVAHLELTLWGSADVDDLQPLDETLHDMLEQPWRGPYDLVSGLVGFAVYALERPDSPLLAACLERIVGQLQASSERAPGAGSDDARTWKTPARLLPEHQRQVAPEGYYNLGLAHGVPGIVAALAQLCERADAPNGTRPLLAAAMDWLVGHKRPSTDRSAMYSWLPVGGTPTSSRAAWCYGDPGVAIALLQGALALDDEEMYRHALDIGLHATRRTRADAGVIDAPICHGAGGLLHVFNRMYQATGERAFADAARTWFDVLIEMREPGQGIAGFRSLEPALADPQRSDWQASPGVLTGAAGIALALAAAVSEVEPLWDRHLLCAVRPRPDQ